MKRTAIGLVLAGALAGPVGPVQAADVRPAFHEGAARVWGEVEEHLRGLRAHLERRAFPERHGDRTSPAERPLVSLMLHHREELGLTPEQVRRLEDLRTDFARAAIRGDAEIRVAELDLQALLEAAAVDMARVESAVRRVAQLRADLRIARLRTLEAGKAVLTTDQRARLEALLAPGRPPRRAAAERTRL